MERSRRGMLASVAGVLALAGCGRPESAGPDERSTIAASLETRAKQQMDEPNEQRVSTEALVDEYEADRYVLARGEQFHAIDDAEETLVRADDLGRAINEAQATLTDGRVLVAASGLLGVPIEQADQISLAGLDERGELTPTEDAGESYALYRASDGTTGGRFESLTLDMQYRGGSAISVDRCSGLVLNDLDIDNVGVAGVVLSGSESVDIRDSRFEGISKEAVSLTNCSAVRVESCTVTEANNAAAVANSSDITISAVDARATDYSAFTIEDYTTNWEVSDCTAIDSGSTPFSASTALNGAFVGCVAEGMTKANEAGFEIEYNSDQDEENRRNPVRGCSVVSCTARDCNVGFYTREDEAHDTGTPVIRPRFIDCTATGCDTGLFIGANVEEAIVENFDAVDCNTDIVDNGVRTIIDGKSENAGNPSSEGQWFGQAATAAELDVVVEDTSDGTQYTATEQGGWQPR
ncbi:right-handed parallel beta-helix repeat-containing protein [Haloarcula laminariae]|uniref:right-handed parallel beta-helix repeat-containing protein n=1 Tax=Haloarcula laminariae TaxID=2961577 RepID=UPI0021C6C317|nr:MULTISPECIES: right-handed parallel beta-helix repeat-containing protein [Halomicroarcula]